MYIQAHCGWNWFLDSFLQPYASSFLVEEAESKSFWNESSSKDEEQESAFLISDAIQNRQRNRWFLSKSNEPLLTQVLIQI